MNLPEKFRAVVITLSDRASRGEYPDLSGPAIKEHLAVFFSSINASCDIESVLIPDDSRKLSEEFLKAAGSSDLVITTGGTGIGPHDITVETIGPLLTKEIPGIMEFIRVKYGSEKPNALLSRGIAGLSGRCLVYTLPGSVKAVNEYMTEIIKTLEHTFFMLYGIDRH
ncbi:MAG TPA: MogA/MoaB family molybdenum cofactor biosynthesis protein [Bacteroidales bacterium]|nr:MogA/MoaB family molybdenum cofactor biosynthesis protein [Bacteroidales bacterium]